MYINFPITQKILQICSIDFNSGLLRVQHHVLVCRFCCTACGKPEEDFIPILFLKVCREQIVVLPTNLSGLTSWANPFVGSCSATLLPPYPSSVFLGLYDGVCPTLFSNKPLRPVLYTTSFFVAVSFLLEYRVSPQKLDNTATARSHNEAALEHSHTSGRTWHTAGQ